jgi:hypothetical protein
MAPAIVVNGKAFGVHFRFYKQLVLVATLVSTGVFLFGDPVFCCRLHTVKKKQSGKDQQDLEQRSYPVVPVPLFLAEGMEPILFEYIVFESTFLPDCFMKF